MATLFLSFRCTFSTKAAAVGYKKCIEFPTNNLFYILAVRF